jgi:hypothetical protein
MTSTAVFNSTASWACVSPSLEPWQCCDHVNAWLELQQGGVKGGGQLLASIRQTNLAGGGGVGGEAAAAAAVAAAAAAAARHQL